MSCFNINLNKDIRKFYVQLLYFNIRTNQYTQQTVFSTAPPKCLEDKAQRITTNSLKVAVQSAINRELPSIEIRTKNNKTTETNSVAKIIRGYWNISPLYRGNGES